MVPTGGKGGRADVSAEGNIGETQNSNGYVHKLDRLSELAKEDSKRQFFSKRGIPIVAAVLACRVLGCGTQEFRVPFQNVFDAQQNIPESSTAHQAQTVRHLHQPTTHPETSRR